MSDGLRIELSGLFSDRKDALLSAIAVKGQNDRIDALALLCREVLRGSSLCFIGGEMHRYDGRCYVVCDRRDVLVCLGNLLVDLGVSPTDVRRMSDMPLGVVSERSFVRVPLLSRTGFFLLAVLSWRVFLLPSR